MGNKYPLILGGREIETGDVLDVINPYNGEVVSSVCLASENLASRALQTADDARSTIAGLPSHKRSEILQKIADGIINDKDNLARMITLECGKPITASRGEVERAALVFRLASEETDRLGGEFIPLDRNAASEGRWGVTRRFPVGTVLGIGPFNFPLNLLAHKAAPAIAAGNPVVLKPASRTPVTALMLGRIILESGLPGGGISIIPCSGEIAEGMAVDERVKFLSFTGSVSVGWRLKSLVNMKKVTLELGGNAGVIIDNSCDLEYAVERCTAGAFAYSGQVCISLQRIYVIEDIYERFAKLFAERAAKLKSGDPLDNTTQIGPMIDEENAERVESWVGEAVDNGAQVLAGGKRKGNFYEPTVLSGITPDMKVSCMEVFAPLVTITSIRNLEEGFEAINSSDFGLQAGLFTENLKDTYRAFEAIEAGGVIINDVPTYRVDHMPYGGVKMSGFGREGLRYAIEEMTELRLLVLNLK